MGVDPGTHLGVYQVVEQLGAGGMGEVYLARDTRLGREVALKVLRPSLATDPDRLNRFKHEARLLAALNHPHIAAIYDVEEHGGLPFLVLELVRGETLADRLTDRPLPRLEALRLAAQIASAIEAAHEQGIIHRDLKPGNIKITPAGDVKLLDFGIAKAFAGTTPSSIDEVPTLTSGGTREGTILGTAAYMSPEQARGKPVDRRTDVWSFGCVLFAMLTGRPAFAGDTLSDVIAAVLTQCPDWSLLPADTPPPISRLLHRCLEKELTRRLHDIGDARLELEDAIARPPESDLRQTVTALSTPRAGLWSRVGALPLLCSLLVGMLLGAGALWVFRARLAESPRPPIQFAVTLPGSLRLAALDFRALDIAPDDSAIAYVASAGGESRLFVRPLSATAAIALPGTDGALGPFFSPDGQWIAFFAEGKLKKVPVAGGPVRVLADAPIGFGGAWADDNTVVYAPNNGSALWRVSADGGAPQAMTELDAARGEFSHRWPDVLPGGKAVVYAAGAEGTWDDAEIVVQTIGRSDRRALVHGGTSPRYLEPGRLLYVRGGTVFAVALDASALQVSGEALAVLSGVHESLDGAAELAVSRTGSLIYAPGSSDETACTLVWVDRRGNVEPLAAPARAYADPRISPDGRRVAVTIRGERDNVWTYEIASNTLTQLTFDGGAAATWSSDGKRIAFSSSRGGPLNLFRKPADGSGADLRLTTDARRQVPESASPDGSMLAFVQWDDQSGRDIQLLGEANRATRPFLASGANEGAPAFSPDSRLIAYTSDASGTEEVYVAPVSDASRAVRVSTGGGNEPVWRREGSELSFRSANRVLAAAVRTTEPLRIETPRVLFEGTFQTGGTRAGYDISADGARFLMVRPADADRAGRELRVFINWRGDVARGTAARQAP